MYLSSSRQQTVEKSLFLNYFYKHCMHRLMAPLMAQTAGTKISRGIDTSSLLNSVSFLSPCFLYLSTLFTMNVYPGKKFHFHTRIIQIVPPIKKS